MVKTEPEKTHKHWKEKYKKGNKLKVWFRHKKPKFRGR